MSPSYLFNTIGTYVIELTASNPSPGCISVDSITISFFDTQLELLPPDTVLCDGEQLVLVALAGYISYRWQDDSGDTVYTVSSAGTYTLEVVSSDGCVFNDEITVMRDDCVLPCEIVAPNVISPNNDGRNDMFVVTCLDGPDWNLLILNRWGNAVYESGNYSNDWGADVTSGVYYYILTDPDGEVYTEDLQIISE
jgi:hypothetical protein